MDEPKAGLDPNQIVEVRKTLPAKCPGKDDSAFESHLAGGGAMASADHDHEGSLL